MVINDKGIDSLSSSNVIATLLPGTSFFLKKGKFANGRKLIDKGCQVSLATDFNPGTCTIRSLPNIMFLAMNYCSMSLEEVFKGVTYNAARAIGKKNIGMIKSNFQADYFCEMGTVKQIPGSLYRKI